MFTAKGRKIRNLQLICLRALGFDIVEKMAEPGTRCRDLVAAINNNLEARGGRSLSHLGHGVGLEPHEFPHLNSMWDNVLMAGEVISVEPGLYGDDLGKGIRIEDQHLVAPTGFKNLLSCPRAIL